MARDSFVCNASIVGLWLGTGGCLWLEVHLFVILVYCSCSLMGYRRWSVARGSYVCNTSIVGLWLGTGGGLWLEVHLFVMLV